jgi:uncharacterized protein YbjT (DUF2867 family)
MVKVLLFGATGMVGQGVLHECLESSDVNLIQTIGRTPLEQTHPKLHQVINQNMFDYSSMESQLSNFDACFFCLGVSAVGMTEEKYSHLTYDLTLSAAKVIARLNPQMVFVYVSGTGTDSTEKGASMWARVKGKTENALLKLPFKAVYLFRPGLIVPMHGVKSKTAFYRAFYSFFNPLLPILRKLLPNQVLTTSVVGNAMLAVAKHGYSSAILESRDINQIALKHMY